MRKFLWLLSSVFLILILIAGCNQSESNTQPESSISSNDSKPTVEADDAIKAAEKYKNVEYDIKSSEDILSEESIQKRIEEIKPFLTEDFYKKAIDTRYTLLPYRVADKQKVSLKPENIKFNLQDQKKDIVVLNYTVDLVLLDKEGKEYKRIPLEGVLTLLDVNGQWLVQGDIFDSVAFKKLIEQ